MPSQFSQKCEDFPAFGSSLGSQSDYFDLSTLSLGEDFDSESDYLTRSQSKNTMSPALIFPESYSPANCSTPDLSSRSLYTPLIPPPVGFSPSPVGSSTNSPRPIPVSVLVPTPERRRNSPSLSFGSPYSTSPNSSQCCTCPGCANNTHLVEDYGTNDAPYTDSTVVPTNPAKYRDSDVSMKMEVVWHGEFARLFDQFFVAYQHRWNFIPGELDPNLDLKALKPEHGWHEMKDSAKVRFQCTKCFHGWTSMKGRVFFWIQLLDCGIGQIVFKLFGQQCQKCNDGNFYHSMWYPEEVIKVVQNLFHYVGHLYYGIPYTQLNPLRRVGKPRQQHNATLCQACAMGLCQGEWMYN